MLRRPTRPRPLPEGRYVSDAQLRNQAAEPLLSLFADDPKQSMQSVGFLNLRTIVRSLAQAAVDRHSNQVIAGDLVRLPEFVSAHTSESHCPQREHSFTPPLPYASLKLVAFLY